MRVVQDRIVRGDFDLLTDARSLHPRIEHAMFIDERNRLGRKGLAFRDVLEVHLDVLQSAVLADRIYRTRYRSAAIVLVLGYLDGSDPGSISREFDNALDGAAVGDGYDRIGFGESRLRHEQRGTHQGGKLHCMAFSRSCKHLGSPAD